MIRKLKRTGTQSLCDEHLSYVPYLFLEEVKDFIKKNLED
jgi:hypothetical protein